MIVEASNVLSTALLRTTRELFSMYLHEHGPVLSILNRIRKLRKLMTFRKKAARVLAACFVAHALLVSTHLGEFWPLSIYPMFSSAGNPWTRALVMEIPPEVPADELWKSATIDKLPGRVYPVGEHGIFQNDLSNFVSKTKEWTEDYQRGLQAMFRGRVAEHERLMVYSVVGEQSGGGVQVTARPLMLLEGDEATMAEGLDAE